MTGKRQVEARWGMPFWDLLAEFAEQGLTRFDTARAIGYRPDSLCALLNANQDKDPFDLSNKVIGYLRDTGETFSDAVARMAAQGLTVTEAAHAIGYSCPSALRYAMRTRGIAAIFSHHKRKEKRSIPRGPNVTKGWPTWERIYALGRPTAPRSTPEPAPPQR